MGPADIERPEGAGERLSGQTQAFDGADLTAPASEPQDSWPTSKLEWALWNARRFGRVFPVVPGGKAPAIKDNLQRATRDEAQIRAWFTDPITGLSNDCNVGLVCDGGEDGCTVADLDPKNNPNILAEFDVRLDIWDAQPTFVVSPPGGGRHFYFHTAEPIGSGAHTNKYLEGLDTRGAGTGYVLAAGSTRPVQVDQNTTEIRTYAIVNDAPVAPMPKELEVALRSAPPSSDPPVGAATPLAELDLPHNVARAVDYLKAAKEPHVGNRNERTNRVAFRVGDFSISEPHCVELMAEHWLPKCPGGWSLDDMLPPIRSAYARRRTRLGSATAEAQFPPIEDAPDAAPASAEPKQPKRLFFRKVSELKPILNSRYLVKSLLMSGGMSVLYGDSWVGKTFIALDISWGPATGFAWNNRPVKQGLVVYCALEGGELVQNRVIALQNRYPDRVAAFALVPCPVDLFHSNGDVQGLIDLVHEAESEFGQQCVLLVIDTASRALAGGNENAPDDMGAFVKNLDRVRLSTGAHLMLLHHAGKDSAKGARGHSILRAATDTEIEVANRIIKVTKQRDGKALDPVTFELVTTVLGVDDEGEFVDTCTVTYPAPGKPPSASGLAEIERALSDDEAKLLSIVRQFEGGASLESITSVALKTGWTSATGKDAKDVVRRVLRRLEASHLLTCTGARAKAKWAAAPAGGRKETLQ